MKPRTSLVSTRPMFCKVCGQAMAWHHTLAVIHCVNPMCRQFDRHFIVAVAKPAHPHPIKPRA